jgi:sulfate adenylyltransferase
MIDPHGSSVLKPLYVTDKSERERLINESKEYQAIIINSAAAANAVMLGSGYFTPLDGFMDKENAMLSAETMHMKNGLFFPVPILNMVSDPSSISNSRFIRLLDPNVEGNPLLAIQEVLNIEKIEENEKQRLIKNIFGTLDPAHPGVAVFLSAGNYLISGPIKVVNFSYFETEFPETFRTAYQIRDMISELGWETVVAFQTRNPMHRAHEELCKIAQKEVAADGILIHMLLGKLKPGDIPADVRDASIRKMVELYFPKNTVLITGYGFDMLYAGPKEALLHALFRQNSGCTHFIVGRDHAGVGSYYGPFDAQKIFSEIPDNALKIKIFNADHTAWSKKLNKIVMMKDAPDHKPEDYLMLSGTKVRDMLAARMPLPPEFARPEVAAILSEYYYSEARNNQ